MKILICKGNEITPKSYPYWDELVGLLKDHVIMEITGKLSEEELISLVNWSDTFITIDSFLPHLCSHYKLKSGIVLWGPSDPRVFGYKHNINLITDYKHIRPDQFRWWKDKDRVFSTEGFVSALTVLESIKSIKTNSN